MRWEIEDEEERAGGMLVQVQSVVETTRNVRFA